MDNKDTDKKIKSKTKVKESIKNQTQVKKKSDSKDIKVPKKTAPKTIKPVIKKETADEKQIKENIKAYKILSYIGILWLIGLLVPEKDDRDLKFHVGQGIILSIAEFVLSFIIRIINNTFVVNVFRQEIYYETHPTGLYTITVFGSIITGILNLVIIIIIGYYMFIGIKNVLNNKQEELPVIGKYSFYK